MLALVALVLAAAPPAARAGPTPFTGTLEVAIGVGSLRLPTPVATASGVADVQRNAAGVLTGFALPASAFATARTSPSTDPAAFPILGVRASYRNAAGAFGSGPGGQLVGTMRLPGALALCLFEACEAAPPANIAIPFTAERTRGVGAGGAPVLGDPGLPVGVTVQGAAWTTGTVEISTPFGGTVATRAGYRAGHRVQLVTPVVVQTNLGTIPIIYDVFGVLTLRFVPQPASGLLLGLGLLVLGAAARRGRPVAGRPRRTLGSGAGCRAHGGRSPHGP